MKGDQVRLNVIGVQFYLVDSWLYASVSKNIEEHGDRAVADSDGLDKSLVDQSFQLGPYLVGGRGLDGVCVLPDHGGHHPVDQVHVYILKLQLPQALAKSPFNVLLVSLP